MMGTRSQQRLEAGELIDERPDEHLDTTRLGPHLRAHLPVAVGHVVPPAEVGLGDLGHPDGYVDGQRGGWRRRRQAAQGSEEGERAATAMAPVLDWLGRHLPQSRGAALLHNDYRLDNCLLD